MSVPAVPDPPPAGTSPMPAEPGIAVHDTTICPFRVDIPEDEVAELRRRVAATRWPDRETVADRSQGARLEKIQELVRYWGTGYDWRRCEAALNALPQFVTEIDGLDIHFLHVRSAHPGALPMIMTHGWPGSVLELLKVIGPLTDPTAHGGRAEDAFDLVLPSMPGYGFSGRPTSTSWGPDRIARAWAELMTRLGYQRYVSQGGDWGSVISNVMARQAPAGLAGIHVNMPATVPPEIARALQAGDPPPPGLWDAERVAYQQMAAFYRLGSAYAGMMVTRPQTVGYALADSPVGLAAWFYDKFADWTDSGGDPERSLTKDEMLDDISLYWFTRTETSSARLYWENNANNFNAADILLPAAVTVFPGEIYRAPRTWAQRCYHKLIYFHEVDKGGHFAAWEEPELFAAEVRAAFRTLRTLGQSRRGPAGTASAGQRGKSMATEQVLEVAIRRHIIESERPFASVLDDIFGGISRPDIGSLLSDLEASSSYEQFSSLVQGLHWFEIAAGQPDEVADDPSVVASYLGTEVATAPPEVLARPAATSCCRPKGLNAG